MKRNLSLLLAMCMLLTAVPLFQAVVSAEGAPVYKMLDIQNGANSKVFLQEDEKPQEGSYTKYLDYLSGRSADNTAPDFESYHSNAYGFRLISKPAANLKKLISNKGSWTDSNHGNIPYTVDTAGKVIKLQYYTETDLSSDEKNVLDKLKKVTVDIENGAYSKLWFALGSYSKPQTLTVIANYTDGSNEKLTSTEYEGTPDHCIDYAYYYKLDSAENDTNSTFSFDSVSVSLNPAKVLDTITINGESNVWRRMIIPAITAQEAKPDEITAALPEPEAITVDTVSAVNVALAQLDKAFEIYDQTAEGMTAENQTKYKNVLAKLASLKEAMLGVEEKVSLSIQNGAKSKIYLPRNGTDSGYVAYQDYFINMGERLMVTPAEFKAEAGYIEAKNRSVEDTKLGVTYTIKPEDKAVILNAYGADVTGTDVTAEEKAAAASVDKAEIDLENAAYSELYLLAATSQTTTADLIPIFRFHYTDGSVETQRVHMERAETEAALYVESIYRLGTLTGFAWPRFTSYVVPVNPGKVLDRVEMKGTGRRFYWQIITAMAGKKASVNEMLAKLETSITKENYITQKHLLAAVRDKLVELSVAESELSQEKQNQMAAVESALSTYAEKAQAECTDLVYMGTGVVPGRGETIEFEAAFTNVSPRTKNAVAVVAEYAKDGTLSATGTYDVALDAETERGVCAIRHTMKSDNSAGVRAFLWSSLAEMKPMIASEEKQNGLIYFLGDSNTHHNRYLKYLEMMIMAANPGVKTELINCGIGGDKASDGLTRLEMEVLPANPSHVYIMFGTNDLNTGLYSDEATYNKKAADRAVAMNEALSNIEQIVWKLNKRGIGATLMTPVSYDDGNFTEATAGSLYRFKEGLAEYSVKVCALAEKLRIDVIDVNSFMNGLQTEFRKEHSTETGFMIKDRIHLTETGGLAAALSIAKGMGLDGLAGSVTIDGNGNAAAENAEISGVSVSDTRVSFTYLPKSIPMAVDEAYHIMDRDFYDLDTFNREIFTIGGLTSGANYTLTIGGEEVGTFTGAQLGAGLNIAALAANPSAKQAANALRLLDRKKELVSNLRYITSVEIRMEKAGIDRKDSAAVSEWLSRQNGSSYTNYFANKAKEDDWKSEAALLTAQARGCMQPIAREVVIEKAG